MGTLVSILYESFQVVSQVFRHALRTNICFLKHYLKSLENRRVFPKLGQLFINLLLAILLLSKPDNEHKPNKGLYREGRENDRSKKRAQQSSVITSCQLEVSSRASSTDKPPLLLVLPKLLEEFS